MSELIPGLVLGGLSDARRALRNGEDAAFLCLLPFEEIKAERALHQLFSADDPLRPFLFQDVRDEVKQASKMRTNLPECVDFIEVQIAQGRRCIVFCKWGQSRSATVVISYLMLRQGYSLHGAFWLVRGLRGNAFPNVGFFRMLQDMDLELFGRVSMDETQNEYLAINLNKQVLPMHRGIKALIRLNEKLQKLWKTARLQGGPGGPDRSTLEEQHGIWQVADGIFVSDEVSARDEISVRAKKINRMLSLIPEQQARPDWADESIQYLGVSISSDPQQAAQSLAEWQQCHEFLCAGGNSGRNLIFCNQGHSRSSAIVISYLMVLKGYTLHHSYWSVRQRLPTCCPDIGVFEELKKMEQRLRTGRCSMPVTPEEYLKLQNQGCPKVQQPFCIQEQLGKGIGKALSCCKKRARCRDFRLYGPLGINLAGRLSLGDLCLVSGFAEVPTRRCLLVAGRPKYYEDQSKETGLDIYRIKVLTPVPPDSVHQVKVAQRMVHVVVNPNDLRIYLANDQVPQNQEMWLELDIHCSPFRDKDINKDLMQNVVQDVERAPCTQAGHAHSHSGKRREGRNRLVWTSLQDFRDRWQEMLESPLDAPIRIWHRYLWDYWCHTKTASIGSSNVSEEHFLRQELLRIMPLGENSTYDHLAGFLRSADSPWFRLDLTQAETRYTKQTMLRQSSIDPGQQDDIERFANGIFSSLVDKSFCVDSLRLEFISELGKGRHGVAYRAVIKQCGSVPAWLENRQVCVKVWHHADDLSTWEKEVAALQRLPATVPHSVRFIAAGRLRLFNPPTVSGLLDLSNRNDCPNAIVTTLATGLPLSKALDSRTSGREGGLAYCELSLWSAIRQILEFSVALEAEASYHGDMTLDNTFWDGSTNNITFIDFGNAGLTAQDPWQRTQKTGTMYLLSAMRERLKKDPLVPSGPNSCLAWLRELKGEVAAASSKKGFGSMITRLHTRRPTGGFTGMAQAKVAGGSLPHGGCMEQLQHAFEQAAPREVLNSECTPLALARVKSWKPEFCLDARHGSCALRTACMGPGGCDDQESTLYEEAGAASPAGSTSSSEADVSLPCRSLLRSAASGCGAEVDAGGV